MTHLAQSSIIDWRVTRRSPRAVGRTRRCRPWRRSRASVAKPVTGVDPESGDEHGLGDDLRPPALPGNRAHRDERRHSGCSRTRIDEVVRITRARVRRALEAAARREHAVVQTDPQQLVAHTAGIVDRQVPRRADGRFAAHTQVPAHARGRPRRRPRSSRRSAISAASPLPMPPGSNRTPAGSVTVQSCSFHVMSAHPGAARDPEGVSVATCLARGREVTVVAGVAQRVDHGRIERSARRPSNPTPRTTRRTVSGETATGLPDSALHSETSLSSRNRLHRRSRSSRHSGRVVDQSAVGSTATRSALVPITRRRCSSR